MSQSVWENQDLESDLELPQEKFFFVLQEVPLLTLISHVVLEVSVKLTAFDNDCIPKECFIVRECRQVGKTSTAWTLNFERRELSSDEFDSSLFCE